MRSPRLILCGALLGAVAFWGIAGAADLSTDADGWHTWKIDADAPVARMCCFSQRNGKRTAAGCDLDSRHVSFSDHGDCASEHGLVQVYARVHNGAPTEIRVFSSECPVSTEADLVDHGTISVDENVAWFRRVIENKRLDMDVREEALFALVMSESDAAYTYLDLLLTNN